MIRVRQMENITWVGDTINGFRIERERIGRRSYWHAVRQEGPGMPIEQIYAFCASRRDAENAARRHTSDL